MHLRWLLAGPPTCNTRARYLQLQQDSYENAVNRDPKLGLRQV